MLLSRARVYAHIAASSLEAHPSLKDENTVGNGDATHPVPCSPRPISISIDPASKGRPTLSIVLPNASSKRVGVDGFFGDNDGAGPSDLNHAELAQIIVKGFSVALILSQVGYQYDSAPDTTTLPATILASLANVVAKSGDALAVSFALLEFTETECVDYLNGVTLDAKSLGSDLHTLDDAYVDVQDIQTIADKLNVFSAHAQAKNPYVLRLRVERDGPFPTLGSFCFVSMQSKILTSGSADAVAGNFAAMRSVFTTLAGEKSHTKVPYDQGLLPLFLSDIIGGYGRVCFLFDVLPSPEVAGDEIHEMAGLMETLPRIRCLEKRNPVDHRVSYFEAKYRAYRADYFETQAKVLALEAEAENRKTQGVADTKAMQNVVTGLKSEIKGLRSKVSELEGLLRESDEDRETSEAEQQLAKSSVASTLVEDGVQLETIRNRLTQTEEEVKRLAQREAELVASIAAKQEQLSQALLDLKAARAEISRLKKAREQGATDLEVQQLDSQTQADKDGDLSRRVEKLEAALSKTKGDLGEALDIAATTQSELEAERKQWKDEKRTLRRELESALAGQDEEEQTRKLRKRMEEAMSRATDLQIRCEAEKKARATEAARWMEERTEFEQALAVARAQGETVSLARRKPARARTASVTTASKKKVIISSDDDDDEEETKGDASDAESIRDMADEGYQLEVALKGKQTAKSKAKSTQGARAPKKAAGGAAAKPRGRKLMPSVVESAADTIEDEVNGEQENETATATRDSEMCSASTMPPSDDKIKAKRDDGAGNGNVIKPKKRKMTVANKPQLPSYDGVLAGTKGTKRNAHVDVKSLASIKIGFSLPKLKVNKEAADLGDFVTGVDEN